MKNGYTVEFELFNGRLVVELEKAIEPLLLSREQAETIARALRSAGYACSVVPSVPFLRCYDGEQY